MRMTFSLQRAPLILIRHISCLKPLKLFFFNLNDNDPVDFLKNIQQSNNAAIYISISTTSYSTLFLMDSPFTVMGHIID